ncbi:Smr domain-containing protein Ecym_2210 [Eremothecium cymbalariae DBVPG|uniref:Smr domain-containing protein n=1 Tax=Eremothecium cymbalariae (strain CBS 270.75 / DBVPG 7215 / KCTC 17166 / NRRL Y-17582) TaxID=931890 RepID=G8JP54_ERECY|nr:Hypothetical protein Ecym_2210 [Eremothecium cymbalariae DBVPG\
MSAAVDRGAFLSEERDYNHADDSEFKRLRDQADQAHKKRQQLSQQSQEAYKEGDGARAKELSEKAKKYLKEAERYNMQAAEYVFTENNADSKSDEIDLHGLYVKEAQWILQRRIASAVQNGESDLKVIVGKGLHSANGVAKIKPAVEELCDEAHLNSFIDPKNPGVMIVELAGAQIPSSWGTDSYSDFAGGHKPSKPEQAHFQGGYQGQPQPEYQQQPHYGQQNGQGNGQENTILGLFMKFVFQCLKKL